MDQKTKVKKMKKRPLEELAHDGTDQKKLKKTDADDEADADQITPVPEQMPPDDGSIKCNPFTFGMLALELYLCKECRGFLAGRKVYPKDNGAVYLMVKMCEQCRDLNQKMRDCFKDSMKKDWPSSNKFA